MSKPRIERAQIRVWIKPEAMEVFDSYSDATDQQPSTALSAIASLVAKVGVTQSINALLSQLPPQSITVFPSQLPPTASNRLQPPPTASSNSAVTVEAVGGTCAHPLGLSLRSSRKVKGERAPKPAFQQPTLDEITAYATEKELPGGECLRFQLHFESNGWMVGRVPMKSWRAAFQRWCLNAPQFNHTNSGGGRANDGTPPIH